MGAQILNDLTGEAVLTDKEDRKYHLVFDLSAVMGLEAMTGRSVMDILRSPRATDGVFMIAAGADGYSRRHPGSPKVNPKLAQRIFADSGGFMLLPVLIQSLSSAEGLGLTDDEDPDDGTDPGPLASAAS